MSDEGLAELCTGLNGNHKLEHLYLSENSFSAIGVGKLKQLARLEFATPLSG